MSNSIDFTVTDPSLSTPPVSPHRRFVFLPMCDTAAEALNWLAGRGLATDRVTLFRGPDDSIRGLAEAAE